MVRLVLLRLSESYFRHRWLYLVPIALFIGAAGVYYAVREPKYRADGVVYVQKESLLASLTSIRDVPFSWNTPAKDTSTEILDLLQTDAFVRAIIIKTDLEEQMAEGPQAVEDTIEEARKAVWAIPLGNNQVQVSAAHEDPQIAYQLVNAIIENYIEWKVNGDRVEGEAALSFFENLTQVYKEELETARQELEDYLRTHPEPLRGNRPDLEMVEIERLQSKLRLAETRYAKALDNVENARLALAQVDNDANQTYLIIDAPTVPLEPEVSLKQTVLELGVFIAVGFLLSGIGIGGGALLDRTFRFPVDVQNLLSLPVLATVPEVTAGGHLRAQKEAQKVAEAEEKSDSRPEFQKSRAATG